MPSHLCFSKVKSPPERADTPHRPMADVSHFLLVYHCFSDYSGSLAHLLMWNFLGIPSYSSPTPSIAFQYLGNKNFRKHRPNRLPHDAFTSPRDSSSMQFFPRPSSALLWSSCCCPGTYSLSCSHSCCCSQWQYSTWALTKNIEELPANGFWHSPGIQNVVAE